jgi:hypothetical protein
MGSPFGARWPHVIASDEEGKWEPEPGYEFQNNVEGEYSVRPAPEPTISSYDRGLADRTAWEQWFAGLSGDLQAGAYWWSGQRSLPNPGTCNNPAVSQLFVAGCEAAMTRLTPTDARRRLSAEYRRGWNEYSGPVVQPQISDSAPNVTQLSAGAQHDPGVGAADRLNSQELKRLTPR